MTTGAMAEMRLKLDTGSVAKMLQSIARPSAL